MIETMPGGVAVLDYNGDGKPDIYFTNGAAVPSLEKDAPKYWNRLYRNDGNMHFTDVTEQAGVAGAGYSMGAAAGDYDNDGHPDLFVAGVNRNILYRNRGRRHVRRCDGARRHPERTMGGGRGMVRLRQRRQTRSSRCELFEHAAARPVLRRSAKGMFAYIAIQNISSRLPATLYHNRGDGTFEDVSKKSGIGAVCGPRDERRIRRL